jgi:hypothetical protein
VGTTDYKEQKCKSGLRSWVLVVEHLNIFLFYRIFELIHGDLPHGADGFHSSL